MISGIDKAHALIRLHLGSLTPNNVIRHLFGFTPFLAHPHVPSGASFKPLKANREFCCDQGVRGNINLYPCGKWLISTQPKAYINSSKINVKSNLIKVIKMSLSNCYIWIAVLFKIKDTASFRPRAIGWLISNNTEIWGP